MNFSGDNIQTGLFYVVDNLKASYDDSVNKRVKLAALRSSIKEIKDELESNSLMRAKYKLHKQFPNIIY